MNNLDIENVIIFSPECEYINELLDTNNAYESDYDEETYYSFIHKDLNIYIWLYGEMNEVEFDGYLFNFRGFVNTLNGDSKLMCYIPEDQRDVNKTTKFVKKLETIFNKGFTKNNKTIKINSITMNVIEFKFNEELREEFTNDCIISYF